MKSSKNLAQNRGNLDHSFIEHCCRLYRLRPFFPRELDDTVKSDRLFSFHCQIFPIWVPIVRRRTIEYKAQADQSVNAPFNEVDLIHACDIAIYASGFKPDRGNLMNAAQQQRRDSVVEKARRADA